MYWRAAGGEPHSVGEAPLASRRYHFQLAIENDQGLRPPNTGAIFVENDRSPNRKPKWLAGEPIQGARIT